jgi:hypothetical protein
MKMSYRPGKRSAGQGSARVQRLFQCLATLYDARETLNENSTVRSFGELGWLTTGQIARAMGMTQSPHLRGLLDELLGQGLIVVQAVDWRPNMQAYVWKLSDNARWSEKYKAAFDAYINPESVLS